MLFEDFEAKTRIDGPNVFKDKIKDYFQSNLNPTLTLRYYQKEALGRFVFYLESFAQRKNPTHILFHMATGSGKTLIMAILILYLYQRGYRNFIFFVNSLNIIEKTRDNFLNQKSSKYLFSEKIKFGENEVKITEVYNFEVTDNSNINIIFTTVQGLHNNLNNPKENTLTYEDFIDKSIILISDEAHHINTLTKLKRQNQSSITKDFLEGYDLSRLNKGEVEELSSWEGTVQKILNNNRNNILLEFTATIDLGNENIKEKYNDKIIFQYDLKEFRKDGFSKEIEVLQADLKPMDRALQAIILSQYRRKIAEKNNIFLKPLILFKSNYVNPPKAKRESDVVISEEFKKEFHNKIHNLTLQDIEKIKSTASGIVKKSFDYFEKNNISTENLIREIKNDFDKTKCISVNEEKEKERYQVLVNTLEDPKNEIRAVFAVEKLNEGWDVLNLFDIVRLYNTRDARKNKPGPTTMAEAQLIGRGARYYPFIVENNQAKDKRKFDNDINNELRIIEQLYYHSAHNPRYVEEIKTALRNIRIIPERLKEYELRIKPEFKKNKLWKEGYIFKNDKIVDFREKIFSLNDAKISLQYNYSLPTGRIIEEDLLGENIIKTNQNVATTKAFLIKDFGNNIIRTAIDKLDFYKFSRLKHYFPNLSSINQFISLEQYLGGIEVFVTGRKNQLENLTCVEKLEIVIFILEEIEKDLKQNTFEYKGTKTFKPFKVNEIFKDKVLRIDVESEQARGISEEIDLSWKNWYVQNDLFGTSEEKDFFTFFDLFVEKIKEKYQEIYLIRNERFFAIYNFEDGQAFEPDFVLFLKKKDLNEFTIFQILIEAKGNQFKDSNGLFDNSSEGWKQKLLLDIVQNYKIDISIEDKNFKLIGLPFYNEELKRDFEEALKLNLNIQ